MIKFELKKAFHNHFFKNALAIAICIAVIDALKAISNHLRVMSYVKMYEPENRIYLEMSLYNSWIGASGETSKHLFYFLIFLLCTLPYSWSLTAEKKSRYINQIITRTSRSKYYFSKYIAAFLSGGSIAAVPMLTNLLVCALFIPAYPLDQSVELYLGVSQQSLCSSILYEKPLLYVLLYILLSFVFCGLWATMGISLGFLLKSKLSILILPFLFTIFVQVFSNYSSWSGGRTIVPAYLIVPRQHGYGYSTGIVIMTWFCAILIFNCIIFVLKGREKDVI